MEELDDFRRRWQDEVSKKQKKHEPPTAKVECAPSNSESAKRSKGPPLKHTSSKEASTRREDEFEPRTYHDLPDLEDGLRLGSTTQRAAPVKPVTALDHYEQAVEKETQGNLGESLQLYRTAFKLDDNVNDAYKKKHFPAPPPKSNQRVEVSDPQPETSFRALSTQSISLPQLMNEYSHSEILPCEPETDLSPALPCHIASLPEELLMHIISLLASHDMATLSRLAMICRRFAFLVMMDQRLWKEIALDQTIGFPAMHYTYVCNVQGQPLDQDDLDLQDHQIYLEDDLAALSVFEPPPPSPTSLSVINQHLLTTQYSSSWRHMFRMRPRIRFGGCYISTVNYSRPGEVPSNSVTWGSTIHIVTYYRYLRFFRDGTCISLLTTAEPIDVVHHLTKTHMAERHNVGTSSLPQRVIKDALQGRWRLSGPGPGPLRHSSSLAEKDTKSDPSTTSATPQEMEGTLHIETEGVIPKYMWRMEFNIASAGRGARNNKLAWKGFWNYNRLTDDWGEFMLRNDRPFYWSRVKSYEV